MAGRHAASLCFILAAACGRAHSEDKVRLAWYTSLPEEAARQLASKFHEIHPGIEVGIADSYLLFDGAHGMGAGWEKADVVTDPGLERHPEAAFARLGSKAGRSFALCPWTLDPRGRYVYTQAMPLPLLFKIGAVPGMDSLDSLAALAHPFWKGKVALLAPSSSFEAACLYGFIVDHPALGFAWLEKMRDNDVLLLLSLRAVMDAVTQGLRPAGWGGTTVFRTRKQIKADGTLVGTRRPREGTVVLLYATAISRRAPHPAAARRFVEWMLEPATQKYMTKSISLSLLKDACARLDREAICGRNIKAAPPQLQREVWKTFLGEAHIPR